MAVYIQKTITAITPNELDTLVNTELLQNKGWELRGFVFPFMMHVGAGAFTTHFGQTITRAARESELIRP